jgi:hypothetical protein
MTQQSLDQIMQLSREELEQMTQERIDQWTEQEQQWLMSWQRAVLEQRGLVLMDNPLWPKQ